MLRPLHSSALVRRSAQGLIELHGFQSYHAQQSAHPRGDSHGSMVATELLECFSGERRLCSARAL